MVTQQRGPGQGTQNLQKGTVENRHLALPALEVGAGAGTQQGGGPCHFPSILGPWGDSPPSLGSPSLAGKRGLRTNGLGPRCGGTHWDLPPWACPTRPSLAVGQFPGLG